MPTLVEPLVVPDQTMYEMLAETCRRRGDAPALVYFGRKISHSRLLAEVDACAAAFAAHGVGAGDSVLLSLPNVPHAVVAFYALNRIGARAVMAHPLSSPSELAHYLIDTESRWAVTMDMFHARLREALPGTPVAKVLIARFSDYLSHAMRLGFLVTKGRKIETVRESESVIGWRTFLRAAASSRPSAYRRPIAPHEACVVLFSGGTSSMPKGIELSSANFNALAVAMGQVTGIQPGESVLAILPVFHGFGLGLCVHTTLVAGGQSILVPEFGAKIYIDNLIKYRPTYIAGVPTLFRALLGHERFPKARFEGLRGAFSGGDSLTTDLKRRFDEAIWSQGGDVELMEGYGLTECVTACTVSPPGAYRPDSVGTPLPGMGIKIVGPDGAELAAGEVGEICVAGPTVMRGYLGDEEATAAALRRGPDGVVWLHTGDLGSVDADGYVYFKGRSKRVIKVSGVSVFPAQVEKVLETHPLVRRVCVVGIPNEYQMSSVKAFVVLAEGVAADDRVREELLEHCRRQLIKWAVPRTIEFRAELPTTLVGKVAYTLLEREAVEAQAAGA